MRRYNHEKVRGLCASIARTAGVPDADAGVLAENLVDADLQGISTHGVSRLGIYVRRITQGLIDPGASLVIEKESPSVLVVDAGNGLGQVQAVRVLDLLMPKAKATGCASATIRNSQHFGALSYYCNKAAAQGMALLAMTNCEPSMSPGGASQAYFGTNPIATSFPTGKGYPVKIDLSTSVVARGNIIAARRKSQAIPEGWALGPDGMPTTDAEQALLGTVLTMAGHKGYALALLVEVFSGVLSGSAMGPAVGSMYKDMDRKQDVGHFFLLLDIPSFMDLPRFIERMDRTIDDIKACRRRPGVGEILVPGERAHRCRQESLAKGIPLGAETLAELRGLCSEFSLPFPL